MAHLAVSTHPWSQASARVNRPVVTAGHHLAGMAARARPLSAAQRWAPPPARRRVGSVVRGLSVALRLVASAGQRWVLRLARHRVVSVALLLVAWVAQRWALPLARQQVVSVVQGQTVTAALRLVARARSVVRRQAGSVVQGQTVSAGRWRVLLVAQGWAPRLAPRWVVSVRQTAMGARRLVGSVVHLSVGQVPSRLVGRRLGRPVGSCRPRPFLSRGLSSGRGRPLSRLLLVGRRGSSRLAMCC